MKLSHAISPAKLIRVIRYFIFFLSFDAQLPPLELPWRLLALLSRLPRLRKLMIVIPDSYFKNFADPISRANLVLPNVDTLIVGPSCGIATSLCPNTSTLAQAHPHVSSIMIHRKQMDFFGTQSVSPNVTTLKLNQDWSPDLLRRTVRLFPSVKSLSEVKPKVPEYSMHDLIPHLKPFEHLESLALASSGRLMGSPSIDYTYEMNEISLARIVSEERVAGLVIPSCSKLRELWIGLETRVEIVEEANRHEVQWNWFRGGIRQEIEPAWNYH